MIRISALLKNFGDVAFDPMSTTTGAPEKPSYEQRLKETRESNKKAEAEHPVASTVGKLAGGAAGILLGGEVLGAAKGAGALGEAASAARGVATAGKAAEGVGEAATAAGEA